MVTERGGELFFAAPFHFALDLRDHARARTTRLPLVTGRRLTPFDFAHHRVRQARLAEFREVLDDGVLP
jgi:hypothetical protein